MRIVYIHHQKVPCQLQYFDTLFEVYKNTFAMYCIHGHPLSSGSGDKEISSLYNLTATHSRKLYTKLSSQIVTNLAVFK